jgi:hypothetical protein
MTGDSQVTLITRPRRFGKTLNMTMLAKFVDREKDNKEIFEGLNIMRTKSAAKMNTYPMIFLSFKDSKRERPQELLMSISECISLQYDRFTQIYKEKKGEDLSDKEEFRNFCRTYEYLHQATSPEGQMDILKYDMAWRLFQERLKVSLEILVRAVVSYYNQKAFLIIDEYDTPMISAYVHRYRSELGDFFTVLYGSALKDNIYLEKAVMTGIQRVAKENIFSGLNNVRVCTVLDQEYASYFGLTESEVKEILAYYGREYSQAVKKHYNGYCFGGTYVYNPWSVINYVKDGVLSNYWISTANNALIENYLQDASDDFYQVFDKLISDKQTYADVETDMSLFEFMSENDGRRTSSAQVSNYLWGLLLNAGYCTYIPEDNDLSAANKGIYRIRIPNGEVYETFKKWMISWTGIRGNRFIELLELLSKGDMEAFSKCYSRILEDTISYYDTEKDNRYIYRALFLGMCMTLGDDYHVTSHHEYGDGRPDIRMESLRPSRPHVVIEVKSTRDEDCGGIPLEKLKNLALQQIHEKNYYSGLHGDIILLGLAHDGKKCQAVCEEIKR